MKNEIDEAPRVKAGRDKPVRFATCWVCGTVLSDDGRCVNPQCGHGNS